MSNPIGPYWSVMHRRAADYAFFQAQQPSVLKLMDGGTPDYTWAREHLPNSLIIARDWALSEQHADMLANPTATGRRHAEEWDGHAPRLGFDRAKTLILGINEPRVWDAGVPEALRLYTIALCDRATELGLRVGAMQLSVGWPNNTGPDTPPDWSPWHGVEEAIRRNNGALVCHEYWADNGPGENWGWWAGRSLKCPWDVPIVIGECGIDMYVKDGSVQHESRGWHGRKTPEQYANELADYAGRMSADKRFVGCAVFAADFANREWASFDIEPAYAAILATPPNTAPQHTTHIPQVGTGAPAQPIKPPVPPPSAHIIAPRVARAILDIESGGRAFGNAGRVMIRFEAHIFKSKLGNDALWSEHFRTDADRAWVDQMWRPGPGSPWRMIHTGKQDDEYNAFFFARTLNADAAYNAISMGAGQIMGFNHARIGYSSAQAMFEAFQDADMQIIGFVNFLLSDPSLIGAARRMDWRALAAGYNGSGNVDAYSKLLQQAYEKAGQA